jgi:hypothetical protein
VAGGATIGVNHFEFDQTRDVPLLKQLNQSPVPLRMTFYWHALTGAADYYDSQVAEATAAGVSILGILGYSSLDESSIPADFDFTEISPFDVSWHTAGGPLCWGCNTVDGTARFLWQATLENGQTYPRVVETKPAGEFVHGVVDFAVPSGHSVVLWAQVGFRQNPYAVGRALFSVTYAAGNEFTTLASVNKEYDGTLSMLTADLTSLAGTTVKLFLNVDAISGSATGNPVWQASGILVDGVPLTMRQVVGDNVQSVINYPPHDPDAFAAYAGNLARRYPQIREWEVWNEPNTSFFWRPAVNVQAYTDLLRSVYQAVKAANPSALVVLGGLSPGTGAEMGDAVPAVDFLNHIYQTGAGSFFDVVGYHVYGEDAMQDWLPDSLEAIRQVMDSNGDGLKPLWITEIGWYSSGEASANEADQADCLRQALAILETIPYIERIYWFTLLDGASSSNPEQNYGLFRADGSPKLSAGAFADALRSTQ